MNEILEAAELARLVQSVFRVQTGDRALALLVDLPDAEVGDHPAWNARRAMVVDWRDKLHSMKDELGLDEVSLVVLRNARRNNADLPENCRILAEGAAVPRDADEATYPRPLHDVFSRYQILVAVTELSATAPLKLHAPKYGFRAATMPGFSPSMIPSLRLDYEEIHARCVALKAQLDPAETARIRFDAAGRECELTLDLRHRTATASGGLVREPGKAGNLPSGETYIVPYEGEIAEDPSRTRGTLPLELNGELLFYRIEANRIVEVEGDGRAAAAERREVEQEPAYANVAELGLGVLSGYGIRPVGELLLDEKLGLHIAFGRSDHFGGQVGARDFSSPSRVVHIDRVYLPEVQPSIRVLSVDLELRHGAQAAVVPLMRDGNYV